MTDFGNEFTGQPFVNEKEQVECPVCHSLISARGSGWFDSYCKVRFQNSEGKDSGGCYVCKSCLSEERKAKILADNPTTNFDAEKDWVAREQVDGPQPGPLETMIVSVARYSGDSEMMDGIDKVFTVADKILGETNGSQSEPV